MTGSVRRRDREFSGILYLAESSIHGTGVFAARTIRRGEYIGTFDGPPAKRDGTHVLWVYPETDEGQPIGRRGRNLLRYLNHASAPNAAFDGFDLFALRVIAVGREVTIDYGSGES